MPNRARLARLKVISKKFDGFWKHTHLDKISSTLFCTSENFKNFLGAFFPSLLQWVSLTMEVEELPRLSAPQIPPAILKNEHDTFNVNFPSNDLEFFRGQCFVSLDKEVIFTFLKSGTVNYLSLASSTTCSLTYVKKLINFGLISCSYVTFLNLFIRVNIG